jgi:hypothetical protein
VICTSQLAFLGGLQVRMPFLNELNELPNDLVAAHQAYTRGMGVNTPVAGREWVRGYAGVLWSNNA